MEKQGSEGKEWQKVIIRYAKPSISRSIWQIINSLVPYIGLWYLLYLSLGVSYWLTLGLSFIAAGFLVRIFIIFHDCGHGSFFRTKSANRIVGTILGSLVFTSYDRWHNDHAVHHKTVGNLDRRGRGDVWTLTVVEYRKLPARKRFIYRVYRNPIILFGIGPFILFVVWSRFTRKKMTREEKRSVYITNLILLVYISGLILVMGWKAFLMIQIPIIYFATVAGVWLFYLQHQFSEVTWSRDDQWDYKTIALEGSSYLKFPRILQWFSGNIGFHHIHHLSARIPNYNLERCHYENEMFRNIKPVTFISSMKTMGLRLWDEQRGKLVSFRMVRRLGLE